MPDWISAPVLDIANGALTIDFVIAAAVILPLAFAYRAMRQRGLRRKHDEEQQADRRRNI